LHNVSQPIVADRLKAAFRPFLAVDTVFMLPSSFGAAVAYLGGRWRRGRRLTAVRFFGTLLK
jgi:hypothetical protein